MPVFHTIQLDVTVKSVVLERLHEAVTRVRDSRVVDEGFDVARQSG